MPSNKDKSSSYHLHIRKAMKLASAGKFDEAAKKLKESIRENPDRYEAYFQLGDLYLEANRHLDALEQFKKAYRINPKLNDMASFIAKLYCSQERWNDAFPFLITALKNDSSDIQCRKLIAKVYFERGEFKESIRHLGKIQSSEAFDSWPLIMAGESHFMLGELKEAKTSVEKILLDDKSNSDALYLLGRIYYKDKDFHRALFCFIESWTTGRHDSDVLAFIGFVFGRWSYLLEAEHFWMKAHEMDKQNPNALKGIALAHLLKGRYRKAISVFEEVLAYDPSDFVMVDSLAYCHYKIGNEDIAFALYEEIFKGPYYVKAKELEYLKNQMPPGFIQRLLGSRIMQDHYEYQNLLKDLFEVYDTIKIHIEPKENPVMKKSYIVLANERTETEKINFGHVLFSMILALAIERKFFGSNEYIMNMYELEDVAKLMQNHLDSGDPNVKFILRKGSKWIEDSIDDTRKVYVHRINDKNLFHKYGIKFNLIDKIPAADKTPDIVGAYTLNKSIQQVTLI